MADFPNRINELRRAADLSQTQLGELIGCGKMHVSGMERGTRELTLNWMRRISKALTGVLGYRVSVADLLVDEDNPDRVSSDDRPVIEVLHSDDADTINVIRRVAESARGFRGKDADRKAG